MDEEKIRKKMIMYGMSMESQTASNRQISNRGCAKNVVQTPTT